jgi:hypothetical protein
MGPLKPKAKKEWEAEYDRRINDPSVKKDTMKSWRVGGSEIRVVDDNGVMRRRNGEVCCGCGKGNYGNRSEHQYDEFDLNKPVYDHHHAEEDNRHNSDDDAPRGYFCSWI